MAQASIPVNLFNPGQVLASLGFLEAAELIIGHAEAWFDWSDPNTSRFFLFADGQANPIETVLAALATSEIESYAPFGYVNPETKPNSDVSADPTDESPDTAFALSQTFPARAANPMELPLRMRVNEAMALHLSHWADGSSRETFKLYSGNRSARSIAQAMTLGTRRKPTKKQTIGHIKTKGIAQLWQDRRDALIDRPFDVLTPMGGSFNFDPRGAWSAIDVGYSPNDQKHQVAASPVVEMLAALGLENARPHEYGQRNVRYAVWGIPLPAVLARAALIGGIPFLPQRRFCFQLAMSGKNKVITFSEEEI
jgi:CRISPR-associated protein Csb3